MLCFCEFMLVSQDGVLLVCTGPATRSRLAGLTFGMLLCRSPAKAVNGTAGRRSSTGGAAPPKRPAAAASKPAAKRRSSVPFSAQTSVLQVSIAL